MAIEGNKVNTGLSIYGHMQTTPYFPSLRALCAPLGSCLRQAASSAGDLGGLSALFGSFFPGLLVSSEKGPGSRRRQFGRVDIFWAFLAQVLRRGDSCRAALIRLQAAMVARGAARPSDNTSAYCQARQSLDLSWLQSLFASVNRWFTPRTPGDWLGRTVRIMDGSCFSMPDSAENARQFDYPGCQKKGCGFPLGKFVGLFCLHSGHLITFAYATWKTHELTLARMITHHLKPGNVLLADRLYCGYEFLSELLRRRVDFVIRLHGSRKTIRNGCGSWCETFKRGPKSKGVSLERLQRMPGQITVRLVRFKAPCRGYRTQTMTIATSLLDRSAFPDHAIAALYMQRWHIELHYRQIKTNLGLDVLRGLSPATVERELWMHAIAYNLIRALMLKGALTGQIPVARLSFKGTLDLLMSWAPLATRKRLLRHLKQELIDRIIFDLVPFRPGRSEPRAKKRRPKNYQFLTKPRHIFRVSASRALK